MISLSAIVPAKPGSEAALKAALMDMAAYVRDNEPGTVDYYVSQGIERPQIFTTYERFTDQAALEAHNGSDAMAKFFEIVQPLLDGEVLVFIGNEISTRQSTEG